MSMNYSAQEAGRPQPQTTVEPASAGSPFIRYSQPGRGPQYTVTGSTFGATITQPLVARPGYARQFRVTQTLVSGGALTGSTLNADGLASINSLIQCRDSFGTPLFVVDGYSAANVIPLVAGSFGVLNGTNVYTNLPSYSAYNASAASGATMGQLSYTIPFEFSTGIGTLSMANASLLPTLQFNLNSSASVLGSFTGTAPTVNTTVEVDYYWLPEGSPDITPPGLGTTRQYQLTNMNPTLGASTSARLQAPRTGGYLDNLTFIVRDSTGARTDSFFPTTGRLQLYVDGVPLSDSSWTALVDDFAIAYGSTSGLSNARPAGIMSYSRKTSLSQVSLGKFDSGESLLSTNPSTLIELNGAPWGAGNGNTPATVQALFGQIVPTGSIIQGLPEL